MPLSGRCLCGAVQFSVESAEPQFHACHCGMCRRWASGPVFATRARGATFSGAENLVRYASSEWAERGFCRLCGSSLFYFLKPVRQYMLSVGAFDEPECFTLGGEIYVDHKPPGYEFAGDLPQLTEAEVLARFAAGP